MSLVPDRINLTDGTTHGILTTTSNNFTIGNTDEIGNIIMAVGVEFPSNNILISAPNVILRADSLTTRNINDTINYELRPNQQPADNNIMQWQSNGQVGWIPTPGGGGATDAFINTDPLTVPAIGSVIIADGDDPFNATASEAIQVQSNGIVKIGNLDNSVLINSGNGGSAGLQIGDPDHIISLDGAGLIMYNSVGNINIVSSDIVQLNSGTSNIVMRSEDGVDIKQTITNKFSKLQQVDDNFSITNANANGNIDINTTNGDAKLRVNGSGIVINDSASIYNNGGNLYNTTTGTLIYQAGGNVNYDTPSGGTTFHTRDAITIQEYTTNAYTTLNQISDGNFSITNANPGGNIDFNLPDGYGKVRFNKSANFSAYVDFQGDTTHYANIALNGGRQIFIDNTTNTYGELRQDTAGVFNISNVNGIAINTANGLNFNGIGNLNSSGSDLLLTNGDGSLELSSKFNDVIIDTEGGGKLQVNQGSEFLGDMTINKIDPQLNFNNSDYPTQLCNIAFESASQELVMEHHSPDLASKCNIRLGTNDINIQSTFSALNAGNIKLTTGITGSTFINEYKLPNTNPIADGQVLSCNIDGESSWVSSPIPQTTFTFWVSNQGLDTNNGTIINPFQTVGKAITVANTLLETDKVIINVMAGQYNEFSGITITKNNITINVISRR